MAEEVWVGTWRPHRPRGPIMALYSSPGPKYLIPPTTGFVKHTPTKLRAPAYSFRGAPMLLAENCSPGPRYSVNPKILRTGKDLGPAFSILGRYHTKTMLSPGPGDYFPEKSTKHVFDSAPSHSISARTKTFRVDSTPGPAAYMLPVVMGPHTVGKVSQPSFSIKGRSKLGSFSDDLHKVTLTKPCAPIVTFGIKHSDYMTPLVVDVE
ncbi:PREDICTED: outer dense fiber protein 3 isoform X2 [Propithecus coquereli]|uniref:Ciliary microtubule associated protein 1A n=1 Tax=Propithecus coquereli TaxID=379532 RepID=A0A2K6FED4_PROCO|nr:PREDICTED: outer dense fiber protein 3 isoform X2 [Propithecus coquereli]